MNLQSNLPFSEQFRQTAESWVQLDKAANLLEETKSAVLSQRMAALGDIPVSKAEMKVKASNEWEEHITKMVEARAAANLEKVHMEFLRMKFSEWQSREATARAERRL